MAVVRHGAQAQAGRLLREGPVPGRARKDDHRSPRRFRRHRFLGRQWLHGVPVGPMGTRDVGERATRERVIREAPGRIRRERRPAPRQRVEALVAVQAEAFAVAVVALPLDERVAAAEPPRAAARRGADEIAGSDEVADEGIRHGIDREVPEAAVELQDLLNDHLGRGRPLLVVVEVVRRLGRPLQFTQRTVLDVDGAPGYLLEALAEDLRAAVEEFGRHAGDLRRHDGQAVTFQFEHEALEPQPPDLLAQLRRCRLHRFQPR